MEESKAPRDPSKPDSDPDSDETQEVPTVVMQPTEEEPASVAEQAEKMTAGEQASTSETVGKAGPEKESDHKTLHEKESDHRLDESKALRDPSGPNDDSDQTNEVPTVEAEETTNAEEPLIVTVSETEPDPTAATTTGIAETYKSARTETESSPSNDINTRSIPSDIDIADEAVKVTGKFDLGVPTHGPGGEARSSTVSGTEDESSRQRDFENHSEFEAGDSRSAGIFFRRSAEAETELANDETELANDETEKPKNGPKGETETFTVPSNTAALGLNLERNSLLTMSPTLLLGQYNEDVIAGRPYSIDTTRQLPFTGSFEMVRFAHRHTGETVIALNTRIRIFNDRLQDYDDNGGIELNDQIQDIGTHGNFVLVLLSTRAIIYIMVEGQLEHRHTVALQASSGRLVVHGNFAYLVRERQRAIKRLDLTSDEYEITTFLSDLQRPSAIAVDTTGRHIFVADDHDVRIVDMRGNRLGDIHVGTPVDDLAELNGILYVLTPQGLRRYIYNTDTSAWDDFQ